MFFQIILERISKISALLLIHRGPITDSLEGASGDCLLQDKQPFYIIH